MSEQILELAEVIARGVSVLGGRDRLLAWLEHPNKALDNRTPMSLMNSRFGLELVLDEFGRMEHGVYS